MAGGLYDPGSPPAAQTRKNKMAAMNGEGRICAKCIDKKIKEVDREN